MIGFEYENQLQSLHKINLVERNNEYSGIQNNTYISNLFKNADSTSTNLTEYSFDRLQDISIFSTRLEISLDNIVYLSNDPDSFGLECNSEFDKCGCYDLAISQNVEVQKMYKKIEISKKTDELIRRMSKMGDTYDDVIRRGFTYLDSDSNFSNQK